MCFHHLDWHNPRAGHSPPLPAALQQPCNWSPHFHSLLKILQWIPIIFNIKFKLLSVAQRPCLLWPLPTSLLSLPPGFSHTVFFTQFLLCSLLFASGPLSWSFPLPLFFFFLIIIYLFIFGCVGSSSLCEGSLQLRQAGATLHRGVRASHYRGLSCCGAQAPDAQAQ